MVNWNSPTETDSYLDILDWVRERDEHISKMDFTGDTNVPTDLIRYNTSTNKWQRHAGSGSYNNLAFHTAIDNHIADNTLHESFKTGDLKMVAHGTVPTGWLLCNGAAVSRTTYSALFAVIGTTYGVGNGSTTFNVPNFLLRIPIGTSAGIVNLGTATGTWDHVHSSPQHQHTIDSHVHGMNSHTHTIQSHSHTIDAHTHTIPAHGHSCDHALATILIDGASGSHTHNYPAKEGGSNGSGANRAQGASSSSGTNVNYATATTNSDHTHPHSAFSGTVGAWDGGAGGSNGDGTMTSGSTGLTTNGSGTLTTEPASGNTAGSGLLTSNDNSAANTGSANPPVLGVNFLIKT